MKSTILYFSAFLLIFSCSKSDSNETEKEPLLSLPILTTTSVSEIIQTSAISGGNISDDGGASITARGVCWSTATNPTINDSKTSDGSGKGQFSSSITGLEANTSYFLRSYATNSEGTAYGNEISFTTLEPEPIAKVFEGDVILTSQKEVDDFGEIGYTAINGNFFLVGSTENPIEDLTKLNSLSRIEGRLVIENQSVLSELKGLNSLEFIGENMYLDSNEQLENVDGLSSIKTISSLQITFNPKLQNINGFRNLTSLGSLSIANNSSLLNLDGLVGLKSLPAGGLFFQNNESLINLDGLINLSTAGGVIIKNNDALTNIDGLNSLELIKGVLWINYNDALTSINGFNKLKESREFLVSGNINLKEVIGLNNYETGIFVTIMNNNRLEFISVLKNVFKFSGRIRIRRNQALKQIAGFENLVSMNGGIRHGAFTGDLEFVQNTTLSMIPTFENLELVDGDLLIDGVYINEITGFIKLKTVTGDFSISGRIENLKGFSRLETVNGSFRLVGVNNDIIGFEILTEVGEFTLSVMGNLRNLGVFSSLKSLKNVNISSLKSLQNLDGLSEITSINNIRIYECESLVDFCGLNSMTISGNISGDFNVSRNAYNPTLEDLQSGNCTQ